MEGILIVLFFAVIFFLAHLVKGFAGFGTALVTIPVLALFVELKLVLAIVVVVGLFISFVMHMQYNKKVLYNYAKPVCIGSIIGVIIGTMILVVVENMLLKLILAAIISILALSILFEKKIHTHRVNERWGYPAGVVASFIGSLFGVNGPPLVVYFTEIIKDKDKLRATLNFTFMVMAAMQLVTYGIGGLITEQSVLLSGIVLPFTLLGLFIGEKFEHRIDNFHFRKAIAIILLFAAALLWFM